MRTALALAVAVAATSGCILFVSPDTRGQHCKIRGEETECGACLTARCRAELDAACFDDAILGPAEQCAASADEACGRVAPSPLATCLASRCGALCYARTGTSATRCTDSFVSPGLACACDLTAPATDLGCDETRYPRTRCCAPSGWPAEALECACTAVFCAGTTDGCVCILTDNLDATSAERCSGAHCCAVEDRCQCRQRACAGAEREVPACNKAALACPHGQSEVGSCAIRR